ncbi:MAG: MFS transporter, partial [Rhodospirillales bacterium]|nr:MFS transporter [Rhodospirillales bacterium]
MTLGSGFGGIAKAFESRNYRIFWIGNLTHTITVWVNRLALGWLTWELTHSPFWLGLMAASGMLPTVFLGPVGGVTADRFGHRAQLIAATYSGAAIGIVITVLVASDLIFEELLLGLVILSGITRAAVVEAAAEEGMALVERPFSVDEAKA